MAIIEEERRCLSMFKFIEKHLWSQVIGLLVLSLVGFNLLFLVTALFSLGFYQMGFSLGLGRLVSLGLNGLGLFYFLKTRFADYFKASMSSVFLMNLYINLGIVFYEYDPWIIVLTIFVFTLSLCLYGWIRKVKVIYLLALLYTAILSLYIMIAEVQI